MSEKLETPAAEEAVKDAVISAEARQATAGVLRGIAALIRKGLFAGDAGRQAAEAIGFLEHMANQYHGSVKAEKAEKKRAVRAVKAVKHG